ncbi:NAD(P)/FAD-dependent oxidoreductase [Agromyces protaetiae]|nr:FAD-dependent oxidoreductase [Agromyces protaetiae]
MSRQQSPVSVVILGGGYAGVIAANRLRGSLTPDEATRVRVTIVNPTDRFVHRIRLHEFAAGGEDVAFAFPSMVGAGVRLVIGTARRIDADARRVVVETAVGPVVVPYDRLVYAVGSSSAVGRVPGAAEHALPIGGLDGAARVRDVFAAPTPPARVNVVGGGPTGIEVSSELAEAHPATRIVLLSSGPVGAALRPAAQRRIVRGLRRLGVEIVDHARVASVTPDGASLENGRFVGADATVWAAEFDVPTLARDSGLAVDERGRLLVDETLAALDDPAIVGAGDAVRPPDSVAAHLPMGARVALPMGLAAAERILAELRGRAPEPLSIGLLGPSISLGRRDGYIQPARPDDSPLPFAFTGRLGAAIKSWVCRMTINDPRAELSRPGAYRVRRGPAPRAVAAREDARV